MDLGEAVATVAFSKARAFMAPSWGLFRAIKDDG